MDLNCVQLSRLPIICWILPEHKFERIAKLEQVFVVRQDLKMGGGKIASQCARKILTCHGTSMIIISNLLVQLYPTEQMF